MPPAFSPLSERFPNRASAWRLRTKTLQFERRPLLMGIVNVTPDSFSDGGRFFQSGRAVDRALQLAADGAELIDIGGESTRPYSTPVSADEQLRRVAPVVRAVAEQCDVPITIDASSARVAREALAAGAEAVNDVTALQGDPEMLPLAVETGAGVCVMHMQGTPQTMQDEPQYADVTEEIYAFLAGRRDALLKAGVARECICLDPGIGFGKTHQHNLTLMVRAGRFHQLGCPVLVGHSRKGFLGKLLGDAELDRTYATVGASLALAASGVQILRVHDVRAVCEALTAFESCGGVDGVDAQLR